MIKMTVINGVQVLTEVCEVCKCHIRDLSTNDILVKAPELKDLTVTDGDGNEVTRTTPRDECWCDDCKH